MSNVSLRPAQPGEILPVDLLLLAEPHLDELNRYLDDSVAFVAEQDGVIVGACLLQRVSDETIELKNIGVYPQHRNAGVGKSLIEYAAEMAKDAGCVEIIAGTDNANIVGILFLQKAAFDMDSIEKDYYPRHYPVPLHQNGVRCQHRIWFLRHLQ